MFLIFYKGIDMALGYTADEINRLFKSNSLVLLIEENYNTGKFDFALNEVVRNTDKNERTCFFCLNFSDKTLINYLKTFGKFRIDKEHINLYDVRNSNHFTDIKNQIIALHKQGTKNFLIDDINKIINDSSITPYENFNAITEDLHELSHELQINIILTCSYFLKINYEDILLNADIAFKFRRVKDDINNVQIIKNKISNLRTTFEYQI